MVDSSIRFMVDSNIHFKVVPIKSIPLLCMIELGSDAWGDKTIAPMWNIQCMPFKVAAPHHFNDFFSRVQSVG